MALKYNFSVTIITLIYWYASDLLISKKWKFEL